jgi:hypothetical protein
LCGHAWACDFAALIPPARDISTTSNSPNVMPNSPHGEDA